MKTIGELFEVDTRGISYDNINVYTYTTNRCALISVWSDTGFDVSFIEDNFQMEGDEYFTTVKMSEIAEVFCRNKNINRDCELIIYYNDDAYVKVKEIKFNFNDSLIYLIIE